MTPEELNTRYYKTCYVYCIDQKDEPVNSSFVSLQDDGQGPYIVTWNATCVQPTQEQLLSYNAQEVDFKYAEYVDIPNDLSIYAFFKCSSLKRDRIAKLNEGDTIYNTTTKHVEVYTDNQWKELSFK